MWNLKKKTNKLIEKRPDLWLLEVDGGGKGNWRKMIKRYKLPVVR